MRFLGETLCLKASSRARKGTALYYFVKITYWKQFDRRANGFTTDAEVAANLRAREAAATAKVTSETARRHGEYLALAPHKLTEAWIAVFAPTKLVLAYWSSAVLPTGNSLT
jgi:hypothetical protein